MLFVDICGSTRLYEQEGDVAARRRIRQMLDARGEAAAVRGGQVLKEIGDELLIVFEQMPALLSFVQVLPAIQDAQAMRCKTGIHLGSVIVERGDVFGDAVNTAARIVSLAGPGQVLLSRDALEGLSVPERPEVRALPPLAVRGKRAMPDLFELIDEEGDHTQAIDAGAVDALRQALSSVLLLSWAGGRLELAPGCEDMTVGRDRGNTIAIPFPQVSRTHLRIESQGPYWLVHDLSANGTLLQEEGGVPVMLRRERSRLSARGVLQLAPSHAGTGETRIHYELLKKMT